MRELHRLSGSALVVAAALASPCASAQTAADWNFQATLYGYFPSISGQTVFPANAGTSAVSADIGTILDNLEFAFMGAFEARQGRGLDPRCAEDEHGWADHQRAVGTG